MPGRPDLGVDYLVGKISFYSFKYADWFEDCANRVCRYLYEHGCVISDFYSVGRGANHYNPDLTVPLDHHVSIPCDMVVFGSHSIDYSYSYSEDVVNILAFVSAVQLLSVRDVRRDLDEIVSVVCGCNERTYGDGC